ELGDRIQRRKHVCSTAAPTISSFAAINQPEVVNHSLAVEAHVEVAARRSRNLEVSLGAGGAGHQSFQFGNAASVRGEASNLLAVDDIADLASVCLHLYGAGLNCNALLRITKLKLEIDAMAVPNLQPNVLLFGKLEIPAL